MKREENWSEGRERTKGFEEVENFFVLLFFCLAIVEVSVSDSRGEGEERRRGRGRRDPLK